MNEGKVFAVAKTPMLNREASSDYEINRTLWELKDLHIQRGGSPEIIGMVTIDLTQHSKIVPRYKVRYPDSTIDYLKVETFDKFYDLSTVEEKKSSNLKLNITINIGNKEEIEKYLASIEERIGNIKIFSC